VVILKIKIKKDKWIVSFDVVVLECDIEKVDDIFIVVFLLENKKIRLKTQYLDETFKILEKIFNRRNQYQYR
jgi:hypothetical protein